MSQRRKRTQQGSALIIAMLFLAMVGLMGLAALDTVTRDRQVAGFQSRKRVAFYAAEAGISEALGRLKATGTPAVGNRDLGDTSLYPHGRPSYGLDPTTPDPIESLGSGGMGGMNLQIGQGGAAKYQMQFWKIRVQGQAPAGATARIEVAAGRFHAN